MTTAFSLEQNFFKLLNIPLAFDVDTIVLKKTLRTLQRQYHPDKFVNATPQEQRLAVQFSAHINSAYSTLQNPVLRAEHMLALLGLMIEHQSHTVRDVDFLMEQMTLREELTEAKSANDQALLGLLQTRIANHYSESQQLFKQRFEKLTQNNANEFIQQANKLSQEDREWFANHIGKMHFYEKLSQEVMR